jgi:hypothetical protein
MLSFELSAIDIILVLSVILLLILYMTKLSVKTPEEKSFRQPIAKKANPERYVSMSQNDSTECPRGFGNIKKVGEDNSVSEKCLGCYKIIECYSENKLKISHQ